MKAGEKKRFDARLTPEQKELFEYAASLTGSRSLTHFILDAAQKAADKVIQKNQFMLISTKKDQQVFFHALMSPPKPNQKLTKASVKYKNRMSE